MTLIEQIKKIKDEDINLKLRTLNLIRWIAIFGQFAAVIIAYFYFEISFNIYFCIPLILTSVILNIVVSIIYPLTKILNYKETFFYLIFDLIQLISFLFFTGGLNNPFCIFILAPLVISATYLDLKRIIFITLLAIVSLSFLQFFYYPLESNINQISNFRFTEFEIFSIWTALIITSIFITAYCFRVADESRKTEMALKETQLALSNEEKVSALMSLTAAAVHELGTPLSTISIIAKELENNKQDSEYSEDISLIQSQLKRCREILERLRSNSLSDNSNEFINQLDFVRLINEIISTYSTQDIDIKINADQSFDEGKVTVSRSAELVQSITNIIDNAYKHANSLIDINLENKSNIIAITVEDDGPGFAQEIYPFLGEPYVQNSNKSAKKGLGLGLFISKNLLAKLKGEIKFSNKENGGGCVHINLLKSEIGFKNEQY